MFLLQDLPENVDFEEARTRLLKALKVSERKNVLIEFFKWLFCDKKTCFF